MIAAFYGRVSTQGQENEETIENQVMAVKEFAVKNGHNIVAEYRDEGWSGTILVRPALDQLRIEAKNKTWEAIICYDPDRIARKYSYQELVLDELEAAGIKVLFVTIPPPKDDGDRLLYGVKGLFAEYERARIAERFRLGKLRKARSGNIIGTEAPYGYTYILKQGDKKGYYVINEREAAVAKMIFSWVANDGLTVRGVIRRLQELNIPPRHSSRGVWNTSTLNHMFNNKTYIGNAYYNKSYAVVPVKPLKNEKYKRVKKSSKKLRPEEEWISIPTPAIIDQKIFDKTQERLKRNFEMSKRNRKNDYLLTGHLYCACGRRRVGAAAQRGKHLYYRCTDAIYSFPLPMKCHEKGINARIADKLLWDEVTRLMQNPKLLLKQLERFVNKKQTNSVVSGDTVNNLRSQVEHLKNEEQRYLKVYGSGLITMEQFQEAVDDLKSRRAGLEGQVRHLEEEKVNSGVVLPTKEDVNRFVQKAKECLIELTYEKKRQILDKYLDKIITNQEEMTVHGYLYLEKEDENVGFWSKCGNCWFAKRRKEHFV